MISALKRAEPSTVWDHCEANVDLVFKDCIFGTCTDNYPSVAEYLRLILRRKCACPMSRLHTGIALTSATVQYLRIFSASSSLTSSSR